MRLTERLLSARGRGSRVVVTVMLWVTVVGFAGGVVSEGGLLRWLGEGGGQAEEAEDGESCVNFHGGLRFDLVTMIVEIEVREELV